MNLEGPLRDITVAARVGSAGIDERRATKAFYEFRKRLLQILAGKDVPAHMPGRFSDLINSSTGKFKHEFVQSLDAKEARHGG
jgi:hypothetical protein